MLAPVIPSSWKSLFQSHRRGRQEITAESGKKVSWLSGQGCHVVSIQRYHLTHDFERLQEYPAQDVRMGTMVSAWQCLFFFLSLSVTSHRDEVPGLLSHEFRISINVLSLTVNRANFQFIKTAGGDVKGLCCLYRAVLGQYSDNLQHFQALFWLFEGYRSWQKYSIVVL